MMHCTAKVESAYDCMRKKTKINLRVHVITQTVYTLAPMYLNRDYFKANVFTIWVHGPLGLLTKAFANAELEYSSPGSSW